MIGKEIKKHFTDSFTVYRPTISKDKFGGTKETLKIHTTIKGKMRLLNASERVSGDKSTVYKTNRLYCSPFNIEPTDKIEFKGMIYEVIEPDDVQNMGEFMQIDLAISSHSFDRDFFTEEEDD